MGKRLAGNSGGEQQSVGDQSGKSCVCDVVGSVVMLNSCVSEVVGSVVMLNSCVRWWEVW
jgi:hypothetical protein